MAILNERILVDNLIRALREAVICEAIEKGGGGELAAQIIILLAFDNACTSLVKGIGEVLPLRLVITERLPDELDEAAVDDILDKCSYDIRASGFDGALCGNMVKRDVIDVGALPSIPLQILGVTSRCLSPSSNASLSGLLKNNMK